MSSQRRIVLSLLCAILVSLPAWAQTSVKLNTATSPTSGQAGVTSVSVNGSGFPSGTIAASAVTVTLTPSGGGSAVTTTATSVTTVIGSTRTVKFLIPGSISVSAPTNYAVTISGSTTTGAAFVSSNSATLTVTAGPMIGSVSPASGQQGQTLSVTITGQYTGFVIGATQANFGPGISVGGAAAGTNGPVTVSNATTAVANITIDAAAAPGARNITVIYSGQSPTLANGFTVTAANHAPTAVPGGPYSAQLPSAVSFDGSGSFDPDAGDTLTYDWDFGDGSAHGSGAKPSHTYASANTYSGSLTVTDNHGAKSAAVGFSVTVQAANRAPTAVPGGPYSVQLPASVNFDGSGSFDPDAGDTLTYDWDFGDGSAHGSGAKPSHTYASANTYSGSLTVTDNHGAKSAAVGFSVTVAAANHPPTAVPGGPYTGQVNVAVNFDGSGSTDPDAGDTLTYNWDFGDGSAHGSGVTPTHTYAAANTYHGTLVVTDNHSASSAAVQFTVTIATGNKAPIAVAGGPYTENLPGAVTLDGSGSYDPDQGDTISYDWDFGDNTPHGTDPKPTHTYATANTYTGTLIVTDNHGLASAPVTFSVTAKPAPPPPAVTIVSPTPLQVFNAAGNPITVTGTVDNSNDTVNVNGVDASVSNGTFTATGVLLREGPNVITATATDVVGGVGTATIAVTLSTTPPQLSVLSPSDGANVMTATITVSGNVNEQVPGTINSKQVTVMVNGIGASVSNRSFSAMNVPLVQGMNTITVSATDPAGNTGQTQIHVNYMGGIPVQKILAISGDNQTGAIGATLANPLVFVVVDSNGAPVPNKTVTFAVTKSDGMLTSSSQQGQQVTAITDQNGQASVQFQLGSRVGVGNNQVQVTAPGYVGETIFTATSSVGSPAKIVTEMGDNQIGIVGKALASPFVVEVFDAGGNPVAYVPVTFNVESGGGKLNGNDTLTVSTDINGTASALLTLGQQEGVNNNVVSATFAGNAGTPASFISSGQSAGPASITSISGLVEDDSNMPVPGATVTLEGTNYSATSDQNGNFTISPAPIGTYLLKVDGHTSTRTDATFPTLVFTITTISGINNTLGMPVCLPPLDPTSVQNYDPNSNSPVTLQMTGVPGYVFTVYPHSVFNPDGTPYSGPLSLSQVHADRVPMAPPHGTLPLIAGTLQPPGLHFTTPVKTQFPNTSGLAPGTVVDIYSYDHDQMDWVSQGPARVSADGSVILSDPGFGISKSGWHFPPPPPPPPKCASACTSKDPCHTSKCVKGACVSMPANDGAKCSDGTSGEQCGTNGKCKGGSCQFDSTASDGKSCTPTDKCIQNAKCKSGQCTGDKYDTDSIFNDTTFQGQINFPTDLVNKASGLLSKWTGVSITFTAGNVAFKGNAKNCCDPNSGPMDKGIKEGSITGQLAANVKDLTIFGPPTISKSVDFGFGEISLDIEIGVKFAADITLNGEGGRRQDACNPDNSCFFGQLDASFEPQLKLGGEVIGCLEIFSSKHCVGGGVFGGIKAAVTIGGRYNKPDCNAGLQGVFSIGQGTLFVNGEVDLPAKYEFSIQYQPPWLAGITCTLPGGCSF